MVYVQVKQMLMKQINSFNIARLRVEEDFGFLKLVVAEMANLPGGSTENTPDASGQSPTALTSARQALETAFARFDDALKDSAQTPSATLATEADATRDAAWRGANNYLRAMTAHPTAQVAQAAAQVRSLFDKYGDPTTLPQTEESGVLHNLLQDLKALSSDLLTQVAFGPWLSALSDAEDAFLDAVTKRTEEEAARRSGIVKQTRTEADEAYRSLVGMVNALATVNGDADYAVFIDHLNAIIDRQKTVLKTRTTRSAK